MKMAYFNLIAISFAIFFVFMISTGELPRPMCQIGGETLSYPKYLMCWAPAENQTATDYVNSEIEACGKFDWFNKK